MTLAQREYRAAMPTFLEALSLAALVAATLEYAIVMRRREERRDAIRWRADFHESLVSVGSGDTGRAGSDWSER